jgi:hypothetical protein
MYVLYCIGYETKRITTNQVLQLKQLLSAIVAILAISGRDPSKTILSIAHVYTSYIMRTERNMFYDVVFVL